MQFSSLSQEDPLEEEMATHSSILGQEKPMDRGAWQATVHGVTKSQTGLSTDTHTESYPGDGWKLLACSCTERPNSIQGNWFRNVSV